jgi:uncharacterized protein (DUF2062 family)
VKDFFHRHLPKKHEIHEHRYLRHLGDRLHDPELWHLNRRSAAGAVALGFFVAYLPLPMHMLLAAIAAIPLRVNLPLSIFSVWLNNPITLAPMNILAYKTGAWILGLPPTDFHFELSMEWFKSTFTEVFAPLVLGCLIWGVVCAVIGYFGAKGLWRLHLIKRMQERARRA